MATTLNPSDKDAEVNLSNGNLTAQRNAGGAWNGARANKTLSGKKYWEMSVSGTPTAADTAAAGLALSSADLSVAAAANMTNQWLLVIENGADASRAYSNGTAGATYDDLVADDVLMIAFDTAAGKLYFGINGTWLNSGDPTAGTGAIITGLTGDTYYPSVMLYDDGITVTFRFREDQLSHTIPTDFAAFDPVYEKTFESTGATTATMSADQIKQPQVTLGSGAMTGAMAASQVASRTFASTGAMTGSMAANMTRDTSFESTGAMTGTMSAIATILAEFSSTAHMMNFFSQASEEFDVWAVTLDPGPDGAKRYAAYPFTNYDFNSFATLDGLTFAAGDGGTYVLGDFDDDGTDIAAYVQTGKSNVGTERDKRVRVAYVVGTCDEPPLLDVEDGSGNTYEFEGRTNAPDEPQRIKVKLARGMKGGMWGWKLKNQDGSDFDFSDLMVLPEPLSRRVD